MSRAIGSALRGQLLPLDLTSPHFTPHPFGLMIEPVLLSERAASGALLESPFPYARARAVAGLIGMPLTIRSHDNNELLQICRCFL